MTTDFAAIAAAATIASTNDLPSTTGHKAAEPNPFLDLVRVASKDGKRRDLPGRFSVKPYPGRKGACEAQTVVGLLHRAARTVGCKLAVRRYDADAETCAITFKVSK